MKNVKITIIDDRVREFLEDCPFKGQFRGPNGQRVCNITQISSPVCVGSEHENCPLNDYDKFVVEKA